VSPAVADLTFVPLVAWDGLTAAVVVVVVMLVGIYGVLLG
jgi:hypothetical protein